MNTFTFPGTGDLECADGEKCMGCCGVNKLLHNAWGCLTEMEWVTLEKSIVLQLLFCKHHFRKRSNLVGGEEVLAAEIHGLLMSILRWIGEDPFKNDWADGWTNYLSDEPDSPRMETNEKPAGRRVKIRNNGRSLHGHGGRRSRSTNLLPFLICRDDIPRVSKGVNASNKMLRGIEI